MKKTISMILTLALALTLALSLAACGEKTDNTGSTGGNSTSGTSSTAGNDTATKQWPDNEFTKQVPKPADEVADFLVSADHITIQFVSPDNNDGIKAYIEQLKSAGFTENADSTEYQDQILYEADNSAGYHVKVHRNGYDEDWTLSIKKN
jgi:ABC-type glycerol-3-phosphate transport system substrate-binding protein